MDRIEVMNLVTSYQLGKLNRRQFLSRAAVAVGSLSIANMLAACTMVVPENAPAPQLIETPAAGESPATEPMDDGELITQVVTYPDRDGEELSGYLARPSSGEPAPAVIVVQEWWGLDEHIKDVTRRFAQAGFVALAPDLYKGAVATEPDEARKLVMELDQPEAVSEIDQAMAYLLDQDYVSSDKAGVVGFCMGGGLALQTAITSDRIGAAVPFYGTLLTPEEAAQAKAPIQGHYGAEDRFDLDALAEMVAVVKDEAGLDAEAYVYDGAPHAFFNDTRADSYRPEAAALAWERTLEWLHSHLG
ncbi:MAG: dienelactone hydrolase family protein [Caldilineaceae bacterium]|jgi:carboxymethylenebutenolidase